MATSPPVNPRLESALHFARQGFRVFPLHGVRDGKCECGKANCEHPGKHPKYRKSDLTKGHKSASSDPKVIESWWKAWPNANVGVVLDPTIVVVDVDPRNGGDESLRKIQEELGPFPATFVVQTGGGGQHFWFKNSGKALKCGSNVFGDELPGIDIKSGGGYIIAPPSMHASGRAYSAECEFQLELLAELPEVLRAKFARKKKSNGSAPFKQGNRNESLFKLAYKLAKMGLSEDEVRARVLELATECEPPYPEEDTLGIVERAMALASECDEGSVRKSKSKKALELCEDFELFHDESGKGFATVVEGSRRMTFGIQDSAFNLLLQQRYFQEHKDSLGDAADQVIGTLAARAQFEGPEYPVFIRIANVGGKIYIDLGDADWTTVEIDKEGWRIVEEAPVRFFRPQHFLALPRPEQGGTIEDLRPFINAETDEDFVLIAAFVLSAFMNPEHSSFPCLVLKGEKGSSKSTTAKVLLRLIDPRKIELRSHTDRDNMLITASKSKIIAFDNIARLTQSQSDDLCKLATGGGISKRKLFTDNEEVAVHAKLPTILTGIEDIVTAPDLLDRCLTPRLKRIDPSARKTEQEFWSDFGNAQPRILGWIFEALSIALRNLPQVDRTGLARMADFHVWSRAASPAFGRLAEIFEVAYQNCQQSAIETALEDSTLGRLLISAVNTGDIECFSDSPTALLEILARKATDAEKKELPKANGLRGALRKIAPPLRERGIVVHADAARTGQKRLIEIDARGHIVTSVTNVTSGSTSPEPDDDFTGIDDDSMTPRPPEELGDQARSDDCDDHDALSGQWVRVPVKP